MSAALAQCGFDITRLSKVVWFVVVRMFITFLKHSYYTWMVLSILKSNTIWQKRMSSECSEVLMMNICIEFTNTTKDNVV